MSLGIAIKGPEGVVIAADSRVTLVAEGQGGRLPVTFDNATKLLSFAKPHNWIGVVTYGQALIGRRTAHSFLPEFESKLVANYKDQRLSVATFAKELSDFFAEQWRIDNMPVGIGTPMIFLVAGFDENEPYGRVFEIDVPTRTDPIEHHSAPGEFGVVWGGQREIVDRLIKGYDQQLPTLIARNLGLAPEQAQKLQQIMDLVQLPIPIDVMALQDCVDLAIFSIRSTILGQSLTIGLRGCGGPIEVATITRREGLKFVQRKRIRGEDGRSDADESNNGWCGESSK